MDAYTVLQTIDPHSVISEVFFEQLKKEFRASYLQASNYATKLALHRNPASVTNDFLKTLNSHLLKIQQRPEMQDVDLVEKSSSPVTTRIAEIWYADKRIKTLFEAIGLYCGRHSRNLNEIAIHVAEYRALSKLFNQIQAKSHSNKNIAVTQSAPISKASIGKTLFPIHFEDLSWDNFEKLVYAYVLRASKWDKIDWLGQSGNDGGRDIWGIYNGKTFCYQCARYQNLKIGKVKEDIEKLVIGNFVPDYFTVVCGGKVSAQQKAAINAYAAKQGFNKVDIWSSAEFEERLWMDAPDLIARFFKGEAAEVKPVQNNPKKHTDTSPGAQADVLDCYLDLLISKYARLDLQGIYEAGQLRSINLEKVYIALKADEETVYERAQMRTLHEIELIERLGVADLQDIDAEQRLLTDAKLVRELMHANSKSEKTKKASSEPDKPKEISLGDVFRNERWSVILGRPGSGKSTLAKWLTLKLARALVNARRTKGKLKSARVFVPINQINPDSDDLKLLDIGPARLPVLLRISDYAKALAASENHSLSLSTYLGHHLADEAMRLPDGRKVSSEDFNNLITEYLAKGQAVIILDGLDEVQTDRRDLILQIESFIDLWINGEGKKAEVNRNIHWGKPCDKGGNQILITSRPVGYHSAPIQSNLAHFSIQPMQRKAVEHFCRSWTEALYEALSTDETTLENIQSNAKMYADALVAAIYDKKRPHLEELVTNPLLITIVASIFYHNKGNLPDQKAEIYDRAIENLLKIWLERPECKAKNIQYKDVFDALVQIAAEVHSSHTNGLIHISELKDIFEDILSKGDSLRIDEETIKLLLDTVRLNIGILAEESQGNYKFIHRQFQEYLAARHLILDKKNASDKIIEKLDDPIWREPILLALGYIGYSSDWSAKARKQLLQDFLDADDPLKAIVPRACLFVVNAITETKNIPDDIVNQVIVQLLSLEADRDNIRQFPSLQAELRYAFRKLNLTDKKELFYAQLLKGLKSELIDFNITPAATADLILTGSFFSTEIVGALLMTRDADDQKLRYPIDRALRMALCPSPFKQKGPLWSDNINSKLVATQMPMRQALEKHPNLLAYVNDRPEWIALLSALYGGLNTYHISDELKAYYTYRTNKIYNDSLSSPFEEDQEKLISDLEHQPVKFSFEFIHRESRLTNLLLSSLHQKEDEMATCLKLIHSLAGVSDVQQRVEALIAIAILGGDFVSCFNESAAADKTIIDAVNKELLRISQPLDEAVIRSRERMLRSMPRKIPEDQRIDFLFNISEMLIEYGAPMLKVSNFVPEYSRAMPNIEEYAEIEDAEYLTWMTGASDASDDIVYNVAVVLDTIGGKLTKDPKHLIKSFARVTAARNSYCKYLVGYPLKRLQARCDRFEDYFAQAMEVLSQSPEPVSFFGGQMLGACKSLLDTSENFICEAIAVVLSQSKRFREAFVKNYYGDKGAEEQLIVDLNAKLPKVKDPFIRFRIFFRMAINSPYTRTFNIGQAIREFNKIKKIEDSIYAIEMLLQGSYFEFDINLLTSAIRLIPGIKDDENRARAMIRMTAFLEEKDRESMVLQAIESAQNIIDERRRALTLREFWPDCKHSSVLTSKLTSACQTINDEWLAAQASGDFAFQLACDKFYEAEEEMSDDEFAKVGIEALSLIWLIAIIKKTQGITNKQTVDYSIWEFAETNNYEGVASKISELGLTEALKLSPQAVKAIERLIKSQKEDVVLLLLEAVKHSSPVATSLLEALIRSANPKLRMIAALLLAETGKFNPSIIAELIQLLASSNDRLRYRAALVLHSDFPYVQNNNRKIILSKAGATSFEEIQNRIYELRDYAPKIASIIRWSSSNMNFDDPEAVGQWMDQLRTDNNRAPVISKLLSIIETASSEVLDVLLNRFSILAPIFQESIVKSFCRIIHKDKESLNAGQFKKLQHLFSTTDLSVFHSLKCLTDGPSQMLSVVEMLTYNGTYDIRKFQSELDNEYVYFDDLPTADIGAMTQFMERFGNAFYIEINKYWEKAHLSAVSRAENKNVLKALIDWLTEEVSKQMVFNERDFVVSSLLTCLQALTNVSPISFSVVADPIVLEPVLILVLEKTSDWVSRMAAMQLLGHLRYVSEGVATALQLSISDVSFVQNAALDSIKNFRRTKGNILNILFKSLANGNVSHVYATIELLTVIGQMEHTSSEDRKRILISLLNLMNEPIRYQPVYILQDALDGSRIVYIEKMEETIHRAVIKISRIT